MLGIDEETMNNTLRPTAEAQAKSDILIAEVVKAEKLEVSSDEVKDYAQKMADSYSAKVEDILAYYGEEMLKEEMLKDKAIGIIVDSAVLTEKEVEKKTAKKPAAKKTTAKKEKKVEE